MAKRPQSAQKEPKPRKPPKKKTAVSKNFATKVANGNALLLDGNLDGRSLAARRFRELNGSISSDLGGADQLSTVQQQLVKRFSGVSVLGEMLEARLVAGDPDLDLGAYATLLNSSARLAQLVGIRRQPKDVMTLQDYLASRSQEATQTAEDGDSDDGAGDE